MARFGVGQWVDVEEFKGTVPWATLPNDLYSGQEALELQAIVRPRLDEVFEYRAMCILTRS